MLFADLKGSMELLADRDPEEARAILDPVLERMMAAVHRYEGTVNQVMGDGIMALFGAPIAHEDHAVRACYAALAMQTAIRRYSEDLRRAQGLEVQIRVGPQLREVVVRAIGNDLHMDYTAVGQTTHLAARMEQLALPGTIRLPVETWRLAEGFIRSTPWGRCRSKGSRSRWRSLSWSGPPRSADACKPRRRAGSPGSSGGRRRWTCCTRRWHAPGRGMGRSSRWWVSPGVGKSRLVYEFLHSHRTQGWLVLESTPCPTARPRRTCRSVDLLKAYCHVEDAR